MILKQKYGLPPTNHREEQKNAEHTQNEVARMCLTEIQSSLGCLMELIRSIKKLCRCPVEGPNPWDH